jgi:hypothetical protein
MHAGSWVSVNNLTSVLQQDIDIVDAALSELQEEAASSIN